VPITETSVDLDALGRVGAALADPIRRRILATLLTGPAYPGALAGSIGTTPANISNHLACLRGCGLVQARREGRQVRYELGDPDLGEALRGLSRLTAKNDCAHHLD